MRGALQKCGARPEGNLEGENDQERSGPIVGVNNAGVGERTRTGG
jgi:hypothetical protein